MEHSEQIERIKRKLPLARNTDIYFEAFGAESHQYVIDKPIELEQLKAFERKYSIELPEGYRNFLLQVGNGGIDHKNSVVGNSAAGPDYGLFQLGNRSQLLVDASADYLKEPMVVTEETTDDQWQEYHENLDDLVSDEEWDQAIGRLYSGILQIGCSGCSGMIGLALNGSQRGRPMVTSIEIEYRPMFYKEQSFLDCYENWLDRVISGEEMFRYDNHRKSEDDAVHEFLEYLDDHYWQTRRLGNLRSLDQLSPQSIQLLWDRYYQVQDRRQRHIILDFLVLFDYEHTHEEFEKLLHSEPLIFLRSLHLYAPKRTSEWINQIKQLIDSKDTNSDIRNYIDYVTRCDLLKEN